MPPFSTLLGKLQLGQGLQRCYTPVYGAIIPQTETFVKFKRALFLRAISKGASLVSWARNGLALAPPPREDTPLQHLQSADDSFAGRTSDLLGNVLRRVLPSTDY